MMRNESISFSFGRNWMDYVNNFLDEKQIDIVTKSFLRYLPEDEYRGKVFVDIGCGSGVCSLSALRLGCKKVISFDVDKYSVKATKMARDKFSSLLTESVQWEIFQGSILDGNLVDDFKNQGDIVYSWGVLHHTGKMYEAIRKAGQLVKPKGYLMLAIYNRAPSSNFWLRINL